MGGGVCMPLEALSVFLPTAKIHLSRRGRLPGRMGDAHPYGITKPPYTPHRGQVLRPAKNQPPSDEGGWFHHTIFSCLTFLSMTWREASSLCTSSREMPASTISTIT